MAIARVGKNFDPLAEINRLFKLRDPGTEPWAEYVEEMVTIRSDRAAVEKDVFTHFFGQVEEPPSPTLAAASVVQIFRLS
jgi:hypothetical protein